jgi:hypothetical protein
MPIAPPAAAIWRAESAKTPVVTAIVSMWAPAATTRSRRTWVTSVAQALSASVKTRKVPPPLAIRNVRVKPTARLAAACCSRPEATVATAARASSVPSNRSRPGTTIAIASETSICRRPSMFACCAHGRRWSRTVSPTQRVGSALLFCTRLLSQAAGGGRARRGRPSTRRRPVHAAVCAGLGDHWAPTGRSESPH